MMTKTTKKLLTVLFCFSLIILACPFAFADGGSYNKLADVTYTFDESTAAGDYAYIVNATSNSSVEIADTGDAELGNGLRIKRVGSNVASLFYFEPENPITSSILMKYSFKNNNTDTAPFYLHFRYDDNEPAIILYAAGKICLLGREICTYEVGTWYDTELMVNIQKGYARMGIKKHSETSWKYYDVFDSSSVLSNGTQRIEFGYWGGTENEEFWFDNYYQNIADDDSIKLDSYNDDFERDGNYQVHSADSIIPDGSNLFYGGWGIENSGGVSVSNETLAGYDGKVMTARRTSGNPGVFKRPFTEGNSPDVVHDIKFKLGVSTDTSAYKRVYIEGYGGGDWFPFTILGNNVVKLANQDIDISAEFGGVEAGKLYDCELIYNAGARKLFMAITNGAGKRFTAEYATNGALLKTVDFCFAGVDTSAESVMYVDDFEWQVMEQFKTVDTTVKSGQVGTANLDETAIFHFNRSVKESSLSSAVVHVNGEVADSSTYTLTVQDNQVMVAFKSLQRATEYAVQLAGVEDLYGNSADSTVLSFTTSAQSVVATTPTLSGTTVSSEVSSYYSNGSEVILIAALYSANGTTLEKTVTNKKVVTSRNGEIVSADITALGDIEGKLLKVFVWSGFGTMKPYAVPLIK